MANRKRVNVGDSNKSEERSCWSTPTVYHAAIVIFLEFFAFGLLTTPMISVLDETFPKHTFLMNGIIHGIKGFLSFFSAPLVGALSDVFGRKPFFLLTVTFTCSPIPLMKISAWWYFTLMSISGVFAVTFSVVLAYVADITTEKDRSWGYGLVSATFAASLVSSPAIGAYLGRVYSEELVVALATAIAFLDICFILACVPESLPDKVRTSHLCSITALNGSNGKFSWGKADPFAALRQMSNDYLVLIICITTFLSYLPEAGQYSCFFVYLRLVMGFSEENVALYIGLVGIMSCIAQTIILSFLNSCAGPKKVIIIGLVFEAVQLTFNGFCTEPLLLWSAGVVAAMGSITYPALSAFISTHVAADQQGVSQGLVTGIRGLCGGLGPALFGLFFYMFSVDLNNQASSIEKPDAISTLAAHDRIMPGPPFALGAILVLIAIIVALFIPDDSKHIIHSTLTDSIRHSGTGHGFFGNIRQRRSSPTSFVPQESVDDTYNRNVASDMQGVISHHHHEAASIWSRFLSSFSEFRGPTSNKRPGRLFRQPTVRFTRAGIVEPLRRLFIGRSPINLDSSTQYQFGFPYTTLPSSCPLINVPEDGLNLSNPYLTSSTETEAADLSNYRAHRHLKRVLNTTTPKHRHDRFGLKQPASSIEKEALLQLEVEAPMESNFDSHGAIDTYL